MPTPVDRVAYLCLTCGDTFHRRSKEALRHGPHKYCSQACRGLAMRRRATLLCDECGAEFERPAAEVARRGEQAWCTWACFRAFQRRTGKSYPKIGGRHVHRIIGEQIAGRRLGRNEVVHHIDENRKNYDRSNLEIKSRADHSRDHTRRWRALQRRSA